MNTTKIPILKKGTSNYVGLLILTDMGVATLCMKIYKVKDWKEKKMDLDVHMNASANLTKTLAKTFSCAVRQQ